MSDLPNPNSLVGYLAPDGFLADLQQEGKVRWIGVSNFDVDQLKAAQAIAGQIRSTLTSGAGVQLRSPQRVNVRAYDAYLWGRYFWNERTADDFKKAVDSFNEAVRIEPTYGRAYAGLADSYALMGDWEYGILEPREAFRRAKTAAAKAIELDGTLGDAYDWDWAAAEREYQRAIELSPGYATAHHWYA